MGYDGASCGTCATGYQDNDGDGVCLQDCATAGLSCGTGTCDDSGGAAACSCTPSQAGADCTLCDHGYQDNDGDGACTANCVTASLDCGANGVCSDVTGTAACACAAGYGGANCETCAAGFQDDDGDGTCAATCAEASWWDAAYLKRVALTYTNDTTDAVPAGTPIRVVFDHATQVAGGGGSLANGDDVRVVRYDAGTNTNTEVPRFAETWNDTHTEVVFALASELAPGATTTAYWLYWNNAAATAPTTVYAPPARARVPVSVADHSTLACERRTGSFLSIQLRQLAGSQNQYEIFANEHTEDSGSYAKLKVVDDDTTMAIVTKQYGDLGGHCCSPAIDGNTAETVTINATRFTVILETKEFTSTSRIFGCTGFSTNYPTQIGTTQRQYVMTTVPYRRADMCGL
ncbi:MAG: hypothetical protein HOV81_03170 [Kofleriaceae bacterium]|nr:hypothetical protein [Kofleriaceae bacterium]